MKGLILKDLYNLSNNIKSLLFMLVIFSFAFLPSMGASGLIGSFSIVCTMMTITLFAIDEASKWNKYALVMPVTKKDIIIARYIVMTIFTILSCICATLVGWIGECIKKGGILSFAQTSELLLASVAILGVALMIGGTMVPLLIQFGTEKGRFLVILASAIPIGVGAIIFFLLKWMGMQISNKAFNILVFCLPLISVLWNIGACKVSQMIFNKKEI